MNGESDMVTISRVSPDKLHLIGFGLWNRCGRLHQPRLPSHIASETSIAPTPTPIRNITISRDCKADAATRNTNHIPQPSISNARKRFMFLDFPYMESTGV